jgi:hypothetical protein
MEAVFFIHKLKMHHAVVERIDLLLSHLLRKNINFRCLKMVFQKIFECKKDEVNGQLCNKQFCGLYRLPNVVRTLMSRRL